VSQQLDLARAYIERLKREPGFFLRELWPYVDTQKKAPLMDLDIEVFEHLCLGPSTQALFAPRGYGKTTFAIASALYHLLVNPLGVVCLCSKTKTHSQRSFRQARQLMRVVPFLRHLEPTEGRPDSATELIVGPAPVTKNPSLYVVGADGQIVGARATLIVNDDFEDDTNTLTVDARNKLVEKANQLQNLMNGDKARFINIFTFNTEDSYVLRLREEQGCDLRTYPLLYPTEEERKVIIGLSPTIARHLDTGLAKPGDPIWTSRGEWTPEYYAKKQRQGRTTFWMQFQGLHRPPEGLERPLRLRDAIVWPCQQAVVPQSIVWGTRNHQGVSSALPIATDGVGDDCWYPPILFSGQSRLERTHMRIDPAGTGKDEMAWAIVSPNGGMFYVRNVGGSNISRNVPDDQPFQKDAPNSLEAIIRHLGEIAQRYGVQTACVEGNYGGVAYATMLQQEINRRAERAPKPQDGSAPWGCAVTVQHAYAKKGTGGFKEARILDALEAPWQAHRIVVDDIVAADLRLQRQLTRLTRVRNCLDNDDRIDALAAAIADLYENLDLDPSAAPMVDPSGSDPTEDDPEPRTCTTFGGHGLELLGFAE
jgi:hypothetical protein